MSRLDRWYRQLIVTGFFKKGWGDPKHIKDVLLLRLALGDANSQHAVQITKDLLSHIKVDIKKEVLQDKVRFLEGEFISPLHFLLPHLMPPEVRTAKFQFMTNDEAQRAPVALHLAGTGDHFYWRRRRLQGNRLLSQHHINSVFLENPYYGYRKPKDQLRSSVHYVNDIFIMGAALIMESWVVLNWLLKNGYGPALCLTGVSMGGFMASLAAGFWRQSPLALVPCLSWSSAAPVYTQGVLSDALPWKNLAAQLQSNDVYRELNSAISQGDYGAKYMNGRCTPEHSLTSSFLGKDDLKPSLQQLKTALERTLSQNLITSQTTRTFVTDYPDNLRISSWDMKKGEVKNTSKIGSSHAEARTFMRNLMDQFTHLGNYSAPLDSTMTRFLVATHDAYVPSHANESFLDRKKRKDVGLSLVCDDMRDVWPGCLASEIRDYGHVGAYLFQQNAYTEVIKDTVSRLVSTHFNPA